LIKVEPALLRVWIVSVEANKEAPLATAGLFFLMRLAVAATV